MASQVAEAYLSLRASTAQMGGDIANARNYVLNSVRSLASAATGAFGGIGGVAVGAVAGFGLLQTAMEAAFNAGGAALDGFIGKALALEAVNAKTSALLKATGGAAGYSAEQLDAMAKELAGVGTSSATAVKGAAAALLIFKDIRGDQFRDVLKLSVDMAEQFGGVEQAAHALGRALESPGMGLRRLQEAGVFFTATETAQIKAMKEAGDTAGAQQLIIDKLKGSWDGVGATLRDTAGGQLKVLGNQFLELQVQIGTAFLPLLREITAGFASFLAEVSPGLRAFGGLLAAVGQMAYEGFGAAVRAAGEFIEQNKQVILIVAAVAAGLTAGYVAFQLVVGVLGLLHVTQLASLALWVAWNAAVLTAQAVALTYTAVTGVATAATWLWNAALAALAVLLSPVVLLGAVATVGLLTAAFVVVAGVVGGVIGAIQGVFDVLAQFPTAVGPVAYIANLFGEWKGIITGIVHALQTDVPLATKIMSVAWALAIAEFKDLWPPLWDFIQAGFAALMEVIQARFSIGFDDVTSHLLTNIAKLTNIFQFDTTEIDRQQKAMDVQRDMDVAAAAAAARKKIEIAAAGMKVTQSDTAKGLRADMDRLLAQLAAEDAAKAAAAGGPAAAPPGPEAAAAATAFKYTFTGLADMSKKLQEAITGGSAEALAKLQIDATNKVADKVQDVANKTGTVADILKGLGLGFGS